MTVFIDTGFFVACTLPNDQWYSLAIQASYQKHRYLTTNLVINETLSLMTSRRFLSSALEFLSSTRTTNDIQIIYVDADQQAAAWNLFGRYASWGASPVDCASFAIMRKFGIQKAYTFDQHFKTAGFEILE